MNKHKINFWLDIALVALFTLTIISLFGGGRPNELPSTTSQSLNLLHCLSGTLMVAGSVVHLILHWDWIKAVILRGPKNLAKRVRANRVIDLWLFGFFVVCGLTGVVSWAFPTLREWAAMHRLTGTAMLIVMGFHLVYHWKWIVVNTKRYLGLAAGERAA
jgi:hypothetical protein